MLILVLVSQYVLVFEFYGEVHDKWIEVVYIKPFHIESSVAVFILIRTKELDKEKVISSGRILSLSVVCIKNLTLDYTELLTSSPSRALFFQFNSL